MNENTLLRCAGRLVCILGLGTLSVMLTGCGTTKTSTATEQLLMSNAVDTSVARMNFVPLKGKTVFLDTQFITAVKGFGFVNASYVISALRQQLVTSGCLLQDAASDAEVIVEARVGTLGTDNHDVVYGIPSTSLISSAASLMSSAPPVPALPEMSIAKRVDNSGIAKLAVFAYRREDRERVLQSGTQLARSTSSDFWILGAGPFQWGTIHRQTQFAGNPIDLPLIGSDPSQWTAKQTDAADSYQQPRDYTQPPPSEEPIQPANHEMEPSQENDGQPAEKLQPYEKNPFF